MIRLLYIPLPEYDAYELAVPERSMLVIRMDIHPRPSCVIAPGVSISNESVRERLQLQPDDKVSIGLYTGGEENYHEFETEIGER